MHLPISGVWGTPTSSVDWCEANYEHTRYVCELFNTISSGALVLAGALGFGLHRRTLEPRFMWAFFALAVVGLGSVAFHATLLFECQMLDELPMLYTALVMIYILLEDAPARRFGAWFPAALAGYGAAATGLSVFTRGTLQFSLFQIAFDSVEAFALYRVYRVRRASDDPQVHALYRIGMVSYALAATCWLVDLKACGVMNGVLPAHGIPNPQLHAWWHVLVSNGLYVLTLTLALHRRRVLGLRSEVRYAWGAVPYVAEGRRRGRSAH